MFNDLTISVTLFLVSNCKCPWLCLLFGFVISLIGKYGDIEKFDNLNYCSSHENIFVFKNKIFL